jgi:hypothetical protein
MLSTERERVHNPHEQSKGSKAFFPFVCPETLTQFGSVRSLGSRMTGKSWLSQAPFTN